MHKSDRNTNEMNQPDTTNTLEHIIRWNIIQFITQSCILYIQYLLRYISKQ